MRALFRPLLITCILLLLWIFTPLGGIPMAFIKLEGVRVPYTICFFVLLFASLLFLGPRATKTSWLFCLTGALFFGYLASILSLNVAVALLPDGMTRLSNSFRSTDALSFLAIEFLLPAILGGWLVALLAAIALKMKAPAGIRILFNRLIK